MTRYVRPWEVLRHFWRATPLTRWSDVLVRAVPRLTPGDLLSVPLHWNNCEEGELLSSGFFGASGMRRWERGGTWGVTRIADPLYSLGMSASILLPPTPTYRLACTAVAFRGMVARR